MLNFGIMGCGVIASRFCAVLNKEENVKIRAAAARDPRKAAAFSSRFNAERSCSYEELVRDRDVDVVYIATIHPKHYEQIKLCLENGKHVLCEKPMTLHAWQARECFALAREKNLLLLEGMWTHCLPAVKKAAQWARDGSVGEVKLITASFCFNSEYNPGGRLFAPELGGGAIYDVGVYAIEFAIGILKENPVETAAACQFTELGADVSASISLKFPGGALASLNCAVNVTTSGEAVIYGTKGRIRLDPFWKAGEAALYGADGKAVEVFKEEFEDGFCYEIRHVAELINRGDIESDFMPQADTIACAEIFDQILSK